MRHAKAFINALKRDRYHVIGNFVGGYIATRLSIGKNQQAARLRRGAKPPDRCSTNCPRLKTKTLLLCGAQDRGVSVERGILLFQLIPTPCFTYSTNAPTGCSGTRPNGLTGWLRIFSSPSCRPEATSPTASGFSASAMVRKPSSFALDSATFPSVRSLLVK